MSSILPDLVEYALSKDIRVNRRTINNSQTLFVCPWCGDSLSRGKFKLTLNRKDGLFRCFTCLEKGGTLDFICKIENKSREAVTKELREQAGINETEYQQKQAKKHPAERLTSVQLQFIGIRLRPQHFASMDQAFRDQTNEWILLEWNSFLNQQRSEALSRLMFGIKVDQYQTAIVEIKEMSRTIGHNLLSEVFDAYGCGDKPPEWAIGVKAWVDASYQAYLNANLQSPSQTA
ncbi:hypothetical protein [Paenibacillus sp. Leaf72]|uniref:hypothetical protein n=1 Tax=Paenibacillus sp. Leaf72 TaxID=1736234 RepID=UPI0006FB7FD5|nr:hypothetical protein [Paenibacillus sp. Leaf72]KQN96869.1 hypothetical protein ASF12_22635 [Paenibacillus sp. Leaf72]